MALDVRPRIQSLVDLETRGWDTKNPDLFLLMIHPDMVWAWPPGTDAHDPADWVFVLGRFNHDRWRRNWQDLFDTHAVASQADRRHLALAGPGLQDLYEDARRPVETDLAHRSPGLLLL